MPRGGAPQETKEPAVAVQRVLILGGGFAGIHAAKYLTEIIGSRKDVEVELISEENYFVFQPLLPEVAAGGIAATHVVNPIRELVPKARFRCCRVVEVDPANRQVLIAQGEGLEFVALSYDHLVFCLGKVTNFASMPGVAEHALAMKDLGDAFKLRNHVIHCLELADIEANPEHKAALLTFVVAGGGFSGVETVGELHELVMRSLNWAVGDCAAIPNPNGPGFCPPTAQFAIRQAKTCARNILARIDGKPTTAFRFKALGMLASLGQRSAVAQMLGIELSGFVAWFVWRTIYLSKLPGFVRGEVEVTVPGSDGAPDHVVARLGAREVFGEKALLEDTKRTATVRAAAAVDVLVMSRADLRSLVGQFPVLDDYFAKLLRERFPSTFTQATDLGGGQLLEDAEPGARVEAAAVSS